MIQKITGTNQSVEKVFQIIEVMADRQKPMKLQDIAARCDIPASTALRLIHTLETCGYAMQDVDSNCYSLTLKFAVIGNMVRESVSLYQIAHSHIEQLSYRCKANVNMAVEDHLEALYVDVADNTEAPIRFSHTVGNRYPLYSIASGKVLLCGFSEKKLQKYLNETELKALTPRTICTKQAIINELGKVKSQGFACNDEEVCLGMRCIAVPVYGQDKSIVASIGITGTIYQMSYEYMKTLVPIMQQTSEAISRDLSYQLDIAENS